MELWGDGIIWLVFLIFIIWMYIVVGVDVEVDFFMGGVVEVVDLFMGGVVEVDLYVWEMLLV